MTKAILPYNREQILNSFNWLGHKDHGFTELSAFHPDYKQGRENYQYNARMGYLPKIWYVRSEKQLMAFIHRYHTDHICCYGVNPRPKILRNKKGYVRSAKDTDIETVLNLYLDFDVERPSSDPFRFSGLEEILDDVDFYLGKDKIRKPVRAFTGKGFHVLYAFPPINVSKYPDIGTSVKKFRDNITYEFSDALKSEGVRLDSTMDLRRVAKIYGTKKPFNNARLSSFPTTERIEDFVLKEYLLSLDVTESIGNEAIIPSATELPGNFKTLLETDKLIQELWNNEGKANLFDVSRSGYDFSLAKECIKKGITDISDLVSILSLRPEGAFQKSGKDERYIKRTIGNALYK